MAPAALLLALLASPAVRAAEPAVPPAEVVFSTTRPPLEVVWPKPDEGVRFPYLTESFTFGNVWPGSTLTVNSQMVEPNEDGAFFAMVPFSTGAFVLDYQAVWQGHFTSTQRVVEVGPPYGIPITGEDELVALEPAADRLMRAGELLAVRCKGPSGLEGVFHIRGLTGRLPMAEADGPVEGLYEGHYIVQPGDRGKDHEVRCGLKKGFFGGLKAEAQGKVSIADPRMVRVVVTRHKTTVVKSSPHGWTLYLPPGVKLEAVGRDGGLIRVRLSEHEDGWVDAYRVEELPEGTPPPSALIGKSVRFQVSSGAVQVRIRATEEVPFEVRHDIEPLVYDVRFFGARHDFDRMRFETGDPVVDDVRWRQESSRVVHVRVVTAMERGWGYDAFYEDGDFVLEIRRPPDLTRSKNVLAGRRIVIDPGHGPEKSAIGPLGTTERDVNLDIAFKLEEKLLAEGADVYMIRTSSDGPGLVDRPFLAREEEGDLYISVHNNAMGTTSDPFAEERGFMVFYYQPQSRPLAEAVHEQYIRRLPELADESLRWGDLYVCRTTQMPAILTESAYMMMPSQEKLLMDPAFQEKLADTMFRGIWSFYWDYRKLQLRSRTEREAARE